MTYPNIYPIEVGRDGWSVAYTDETSRLLFLCGLRPGPRDHTWSVTSSHVVKDGVKTALWDTSLVRPTKDGVRAALKSLSRLRGRPIVAAVLHRYGAKSVDDLGKQWYGVVYDSAQRYIREM